MRRAGNHRWYVISEMFMEPMFMEFLTMEILPEALLKCWHIKRELP